MQLQCIVFYYKDGRGRALLEHELLQPKIYRGQLNSSRFKGGGGGRIVATRYLIKLGAYVNVINHKGNTPLYELMKGTMLRRIG